MKNFSIFLLGLIVSFAQAQNKKSDLIVTHAKVHTLDDQAAIVEAFAIKDGKIVATGSNAEIVKWKAKGTLHIDAGGKTVIPGIFDSHLHVIRGGRFYNAELRWDGVRSLKVALNMLKEQAQRTPPGQWVRVVGGWSPYQFEERRFPTLEEINEATADVPAFVLYLYGHAYLNKAGLKALNIVGNTPNPAGGLIEKDHLGNPTGLLVAEPNAFLLYSTLARLPELSEEEKLNSTKHYMWELNRLGITSVMDAGGGFQNFPDDYGITDLLCEMDELTIRLPYYLFAQKPGTERNDFENWIRSVEIGHSCDAEVKPRIRTFGQKFIEYHVQGAGENLVASAADFENFDQPRPDLSPEMESQLYAVISLLVKNRWPFRLHATYNESITRFLDVIERVDNETPIDGLMWFFDHAETVSEQNLVRIKSLGGGIAIQFRMAFQGESFIKRYGKDAAMHTPPVKKMLQLGIPVGMGSDGTRVSSFSPWIGLYWLTTGKTVGGNAHMSTDNLLDRTTALKLYTEGSANLLKLKDRGLIKVGQLADFAILSADYFEVEEGEILKIESLLTVVGGQVMFAQEEFKNFGKPLPEATPSWSPINFYGGYQNK